MSSNASYSGRRYGSIFSFKSPGKKPRFSPASTAGRVNMIRFISLFLSARTANATAVYVLPVPAGPMANRISLLFIQSTIRRWLAVRAFTITPLGPKTITSPEANLSAAGSLAGVLETFEPNIRSRSVIFRFSYFSTCCNKLANFS